MRFLCDNCKAKYQIADERAAGRTVRMKCRKCGHLIEVNASVTETSVSAGTSTGEANAPSKQGTSDSREQLGKARREAGAPPRPGAGSAKRGATSGAGAGREGTASGSAGLAGAFSKAVVASPAEGPSAMSTAVAVLSTSNNIDEWYVGIHGVPVGPVRLSDLRRKAQQGLIDEESLVWREGFEEWVPLRTFPELSALLREATASTRASFTPPAPMHPPAGVPRPASVSTVARPAVTPTKPSVPDSSAARSNVVPIASRRTLAEKSTPLPTATPDDLSARSDFSRDAGVELPPTVSAPADRKSRDPSSASAPFVPANLLGGVQVSSRAAAATAPTAPTVPTAPTAPAAPTAAIPVAPAVPPAAGAVSEASVPVAPTPPTPWLGPAISFAPGPASASVAPASTTSPSLGATVSEEGDAEPRPRRRAGGTPNLVKVLVPVLLAGMLGGMGIMLLLEKPSPHLAPVPSSAVAPSAVPLNSAATVAKTEKVEAPDDTTTTIGPIELSPTAHLKAQPAGRSTKTDNGAPGSAAGAASGASVPPGLAAMLTAGGPSPGPGAAQPGGGGQLTEADISRVVQSRRAFVSRRCWEPVMNARPSGGATNAKVNVSLSIAADGRVTEANATGGDGFPGLASCIQGLVRTWTFPRNDGQSVIKIPFVFAGQ